MIVMMSKRIQFLTSSIRSKRKGISKGRNHQSYCSDISEEEMEMEETQDRVKRGSKYSLFLFYV